MICFLKLTNNVFAKAEEDITDDKNDLAALRVEMQAMQALIDQQKQEYTTMVSISNKLIVVIQLISYKRYLKWTLDQWRLFIYPWGHR